MKGRTLGLWAQIDDWRAISQGARESQISWTTMLLAVLVMAALTAGVVYLVAVLKNHETQPTHKPNHSGLFDELCAAHGLDHQERALLAELASRAQVKHAASLFLRPDRFRQGVEKLGDRDRSATSGAVEGLQAKLFAASGEPERASAQA